MGKADQHRGLGKYGLAALALGLALLGLPTALPGWLHLLLLTVFAAVVYVFAVIVATVCCYKGYFTHMRPGGQGAKGVGQATTSAVVLSCVCILVSDYIVTSFLM